MFAELPSPHGRLWRLSALSAWATAVVAGSGAGRENSERVNTASQVGPFAARAEAEGKYQSPTINGQIQRRIVGANPLDAR